MIPVQRAIENNITNDFHVGKAIIVIGARQVGKSTMLKNILKARNDVLWLDAEEPDVVQMFIEATSVRLKSLFQDKKIIVIDEAQKIENIGSKIKLIVDHISGVQLIATGSSAFDLRNRIAEPLTGRKWEYELFPFCFSELANNFGLIEEKRNLHNRLVYGSYPEIINDPLRAEERLKTLTESYLYKDILMWGGIKKPEKLEAILKALAWQVGSEVSYQELGNMVQLKNDTVSDYISLLEKCYVIFRLNAYSTNHRKELKKAKKIYFYDNGIRNMLIGDFRPIENRSDSGALFENYCVSELLKKFKYEKNHSKFYFWRTVDQQEIDLIIEENDFLRVFEIKYSPTAKVKLNKTFSNHYPKHTFSVINSQNLSDFLMG